MSGVEDGTANGRGGEFVDADGPAVLHRQCCTHTQTEEKGSGKRQQLPADEKPALVFVYLVLTLLERVSSCPGEREKRTDSGLGTRPVCPPFHPQS